MRYKKTEAKFKSHYILKRFVRQIAINNNDVSAGKSNRKCNSIYLYRYSLRFENLSIISHRPVTRSDLKQERSFFRGSVSTFLQLVVASACPNGKL